MQDFEKLAAFYLGRQYDLKQGQRRDDLVLYDAKDLTTHAVCVGMTGSGKTGLCLALLEEAAIDGIPAIAIDPKGDLGNLLLTFPDLAPADFRPWVDPAEATRRGVTPEQFAADQAAVWKQGLQDWGQDGQRIARFRDGVDVAIYTPGSNTGLPLTVLRSFDAPPQAIRDDSEAMRDRVTAAASGLLTLLGVDADPLRSREHILVANLLDRAWRTGRCLQIVDLIREIQSPPMEKVGVVDLDTFFPANDRFALAMQLNNLLASPGFAGWMEGEPLDVHRLLYTESGKPRLSILSIAHLSESERMFFVTILLNEVLAWVRAQSGTSSLRAMLYMDEVFGYFPPTANPPSKRPMLTLLKQARAFGLGVMLATQNPVDLDYKGLSNAGTWFLGRLQTERDKARVLEGLEGASVAAGAVFDRGEMEATLSALGNRVFLMNNVHDDRPVVFQTRWALSYLRGPLTRQQIQTLMNDRKQAAETPPAAETSAPTRAALRESVSKSLHDAAAPLVPPDITQYYLPAKAIPQGAKLLYRPSLFGIARLHFVDAKSQMDHWREVAMLAPIRGDVAKDPWGDADQWQDANPRWARGAEEGAGFAALPGEMAKARNYVSWGKRLRELLYRERRLTLWHCPLLDAYSAAGESERDFRLRLQQLARERRDLELEKLRKQYAPKLQTLKDRIERAEAKVEKERSQYQQQKLQTAISFGSSILGALFGRKLASTTNVTRAATAMRSAGRAMDERSDISQAEDTVESLQDDLVELERDFERQVAAAEDSLKLDELKFETIEVKPRKTDLELVEPVALVWTPWAVDADGIAEPLFEP